MQTLSLDSFNTNHPLYERLKDLGIPKTKTEQYKNFPIKSMLDKEYKFEKLRYEPVQSGDKLVIENGVVLEYPKNVTIMFDKSFEADKEHFDATYFISHILSPTVINIEILEDIKFEIQHRFSDKETLLSYRVFIKTAPSIKVEILESFYTFGSENSLLLYGVDADIEKKSTLTWVRDENRFDNEANILGSHSYNLKDNAALELKTFDFGSANSLHLYKIDLARYAWTDAAHLLLANKRARRGNVVQINHNAEYAKSVQEARSILKDNATGIFDAKILVTQDAKYSNAAQNSKAILLDESTRMYAKPQLEIYIDELEASHGSSIGTLDEEALFYLCSRGISRSDAKKMLVLAFANRLIDTVADASFIEKIRNDFEGII